MARLWMACAGLVGVVAVAMAAAAAHALPQRLDAAAMAQVRSGVQMQGWHAIMLAICALWAPRGGWLADAAGASFLVGTLLFCGAVYALALAGLRSGPVAPAGGLLMMFGWICLAASALRG